MAIKELELKNIDPMQLFKVVTLLVLIGALIMGVIMLVMGIATNQGIMPPLMATVLLLILAPVYGLAAAIFALLYNFVAGKVGGYKCTLGWEDKQ